MKFKSLNSTLEFSMKWILRLTAIAAVLTSFSSPANAQEPSANWFVSLEGGIGYSRIPSTMTVNNGSGLEAPYNQDIYTTNNNSDPAIGFSVGRRYERTNSWISAYSLGLAYQNILATNIGHTVMLYSTPEFTNYNYNSYISSNVLLAFAKINLFTYRLWSPFIKGGIGWALNRSSDYTESALADVTPRTSPAFASKTSGQFAYNLGVGVDFSLSSQLVLSVSYEYLNLGNVTSEHGTDAWRSQSLNVGTYHVNEALLSLSYLFDK